MFRFQSRRSRRRRILTFPACLVALILFRYTANDKANVHPCPYSSRITGNHIIFDNTSYSIHHYPEFICPQNFRNLADWIYGWPENEFAEQLEDFFQMNNETVKNLPDGSIIYVKTDRVPSFFGNIYPFLTNKFVLITGQSDTETPSDFLHYLEDPGSKIIHWFGQNGNIDQSRSKRFTHIPIGKDYRCMDQDYEKLLSRLNLKIVVNALWF
jgi:hypothetical protein